MSTPYLKPSWMQRNVGNRLAPLFAGSRISRLEVRGRRSGRPISVPIAVLEHEGERYLVSYRGASDWARNLRAAGTGRLTTGGQAETITAVEVPAAQRPELWRRYGEKFGSMPTVGGVVKALPDPADHPIFRIGAADR